VTRLTSNQVRGLHDQLPTRDRKRCLSDHDPGAQHLRGALAGECHRAWRRYELQAEAEDHAKFVVTGTALAYRRPLMKINPLPAGFVVPLNRLKPRSRRSAPTGS
jgi:hypothetical protein